MSSSMHPSTMIFPRDGRVHGFFISNVTPWTVTALALELGLEDEPLQAHLFLSHALLATAIDKIYKGAKKN